MTDTYIFYGIGLSLPLTKIKKKERGCNHPEVNGAAFCPKCGVKLWETTVTESYSDAALNTVEFEEFLNGQNFETYSVGEYKNTPMLYLGQFIYDDWLGNPTKLKNTDEIRKLAIELVTPLSANLVKRVEKADIDIRFIYI